MDWERGIFGNLTIRTFLNQYKKIKKQINKTRDGARNFLNKYFIFNQTKRKRRKVNKMRMSINKHAYSYVGDAFCLNLKRF